MKSHPLPTYLQRFFNERLGTQLKTSPNTITSYRDMFRLLLKFAANLLRRPPTELQVVDIDADLIRLFLTDIESTRGNSARSRNTRLSAIRSFFKYVAVNEPQLLHHCQRVLAMLVKRHEGRAIDYLSRAEIEALIEAPDLLSWHGRRDRALLALALQTGLRVSELISLSCRHRARNRRARAIMGKGRKERSTPILKDSVRVLRDWLTERGGAECDPVFVSNRNQRLSRNAVEQIVRKHVSAAAGKCPSLKKKRVTPHVLRHSAAMQHLQNDVDRTVIALWLGHESVETTHMYIHADMQIKEKAMARTRPVKAPPGRYRPDDKLLAFLEAL